MLSHPIARRRSLIGLAATTLLISLGSARGQNGPLTVLTVASSDYAPYDQSGVVSEGMGTPRLAPSAREMTDPRSAGGSSSANSTGFYPFYVSNPQHGPVITTAENHPIYINNPPSHWGDPATFLTDLGNSDYIHLLDQYVGSHGNHRYTLGTAARKTFCSPLSLYLSEWLPSAVGLS